MNTRYTVWTRVRAEDKLTTKHHASPHFKRAHAFQRFKKIYALLSTTCALLLTRFKGETIWRHSH